MRTVILLVLSSFALAASAQTIELTPTDDVWVYPHASDNADAYLRIWGSEGKSVAGPGNEIELFSYSYLRFDTTTLPKDKKLVHAKLVLHHVANPTWSDSIAEGAPVEVRGLNGTFDEKTWNFERVDKINPTTGNEGLLSKLSPKVAKPAESVTTVELPFEVKGNFGEYLKKSSPGGALFLALASSLDPQSSGERTVYKFYSKDGPKDSRPKLVLTFE